LLPLPKVATEMALCVSAPALNDEEVARAANGAPITD
jgi:hypothetical protein